MNKKQPYGLGTAYTDSLFGVDRTLLAVCLDKINTEIGSVGRDGGLKYAIEFGTGTGFTTEMIAQILPVISFDSFQGLPEDWRPGFPVGHFSDLAEPKHIIGATIVPGWFEHTLPDYEWPGEIALIHFDADLYSSTTTALNAIGPYIEPGCVVVFDEWHGYSDDLYGTNSMTGEQRAWVEYVSENPMSWEVIGHGREQWAIKIIGVNK